MAEASVVVFFSISVFLGTVAFSATGFAMAIIFLFLYQLGSLDWLECCNIRYAVFIQTVAFVVILPIVLWRAQLKKNIRFDLLIGFVPITFVATPLGQYLQDSTPVGALKIVVGVLSILVSLWQIYQYVLNKKKEKSSPSVQKSVDIEHEGRDQSFENPAFHEVCNNEGNSSSSSNVFFLIGSQRSGSNWLHTMITESQTIATPHPPHVLKHFLPIIHKFGDLTVPENLQRLVDLVCEFVEKNPVPWLDKGGAQITFDRLSVFNKCRTAKIPLIAIFESLMNEFTERNGCQTWVCKSMSYGKFHKELSEHFSSRLRYIYLYRDPRDVCLSSYKAVQIANSHYYVIAQTWRKLQLVAINLMDTLPSHLVHRLTYESLLTEKKPTIDKLFEFLNTTASTSTMSSHASKEALLRANKSSLWKNLTRGDSFRGDQLKKWERKGGLSSDDVRIIENVCQDVMEKLGYTLEYGDELQEFTGEGIDEFERLNEEGKARKKNLLEQEDPEDYQRRKTQQNVLQKVSSQGVVLLHQDTSSTPSTLSFWADAKQQLWPLRPLLLWIVLAGFASGFLGGLIGVRGPPLIILFFFFEYPKSQIKANGAVVATINVLIRIITYAVKAPPDSYPSKTWFTDADTYLYVCVALSGLVATPLILLSV